MKKQDLNYKNTLTIGKIAFPAISSVLPLALAICLVLPAIAFSQSRGAIWVGLSQPSTAQTNGQTARTCPTSQAKQIIYSADARASIPVSLGSTWSAAFQMVAMMLGNLNANACAETNSSNIAGVKYEDITISP